MVATKTRGCDWLAGARQSDPGLSAVAAPQLSARLCQRIGIIQITGSLESGTSKSKGQTLMMSCPRFIGLSVRFSLVHYFYANALVGSDSPKRRVAVDARGLLCHAPSCAAGSRDCRPTNLYDSSRNLRHDVAGLVLIRFRKYGKTSAFAADCHCLLPSGCSN